MDNGADSPPVRATSVQAGAIAEGASGTRGSSPDPNRMITLQLLSLSQSTVSAPPEPRVRKHGPISPEEFQALATFVYENPWTGSGRSGYIAHFEKFRQTVIDFYHSS